MPKPTASTKFAEVAFPKKALVANPEKDRETKQAGPVPSNRDRRSDALGGAAIAKEPVPEDQTLKATLATFRRLVSEVEKTVQAMASINRAVKAMKATPALIASAMWFLTKGDDQYVKTETAGYHVRRRGGSPATRIGLSGLTGEQWRLAWSDRLGNIPRQTERTRAIEGAVRYLIRTERILQFEGRQPEPRILLMYYLYGEPIPFPPDHDGLLELARAADPNNTEANPFAADNTHMAYVREAPTAEKEYEPEPPAKPAALPVRMNVTADGIDVELPEGMEET